MRVVFFTDDGRLLALVLVSAQPIDLLVSGTAVVGIFAIGTIVWAVDAAHIAHLGQWSDRILLDVIVGRLETVVGISARQLTPEGYNVSVATPIKIG